MNTINKYNESKVFFTSDTHFNHTNILRFCDRPFKSIEEMNETMINNWNDVVGMDDDVFHLGDFCLGGAAGWTKILDRLNGKIHLIVRNHDLKNLRQGFVTRFEEVVMQRHIVIDKHSIYLNHYPFLCFSGSYKDDIWQFLGLIYLLTERLEIKRPSKGWSSIYVHDLSGGHKTVNPDKSIKGFKRRGEQLIPTKKHEHRIHCS